MPGWRRRLNRVRSRLNICVYFGMDMNNAKPDSPARADRAVDALVVCLCAQWCGACRDYRARFDAVALKFPDTRFLWIDIEDEADLLHPLDIEDFPTLMLAAGGEPRFLGPLTPQAQTLERMIRSHVLDASARPLAEPEATRLLQRILTAHPR
jgi:thiol-disulfide isomerase/thioredoxin